MSKQSLVTAALKYHSQGQPGKIEVVPTKPVSTQRDLALAYSPGVAEPCLKIAENPDDVYKYTAKGNLVGVITNGTAVLGLGNIGPAASKPVMEGKAVLFKRFAGIDVFDIEIDCEDPDEFIQTVKNLEPTFGGINLEDIKAPESFKIERELREKMNIPVMHDDQHGTAIISAAALLNALEITDRKINEAIIVVNGAGAAAISCTKLYVDLGVKKENIIMLDSKGVIRTDREGLDPSKAEFATNRDIYTLDEALKGAEVFLGLSTGNIMTAEMLLSMADRPIVFALANPNPEIPYDLAMDTRKDIIMATGRSDHPNQVNNVLGFPFIFRGAIDVRATEINEAMKLATVYALAEMAKEPVPDIVSQAYGDHNIKFGETYLIPKPLDPRLITRIAPAVAKAAMESGVARVQITDWEAYKDDLMKRLGIDTRLMSLLSSRAKKNPKRVVFTEANNPSILKAALIAKDDGICEPILLADRSQVEKIVVEYDLDESILSCLILNPLAEKGRRETYGSILYEKRKRKGMKLEDAQKLMTNRMYFGCAMLETGEADALISGLTKDYPTTVTPALHMVGKEDGINRIAGMYIMMTKKGNFFFADTTLNINPNAEELADIAILTADTVKLFEAEPKVTFLSYSNFGSAKGEVPEKTAKAVQIVNQRRPDIKIEGEMQANIALNPQLQKEMYPFSTLADENVNTLIFPDLASGNISYKLLMELGGADAIGPVLVGMKKPVHILQQGSSVRDIINMITIAVVDAQRKEKK
jgi:malate dehydrogenase (oxaloacetate-decarboxylating)(NADP+)